MLQIRLPPGSSTDDHSIEVSDRIEFQRVIVRVDSAGQLKASTTGTAGVVSIGLLVGANASIVVPPGPILCPWDHMSRPSWSDLAPGVASENRRLDGMVDSLT